MAVALVLLPLFAAIITGLFGRTLGDRASQIITCGALIVSAVLAMFVFNNVVLHHETGTVTLFRWIDTGPLKAYWAVRLDSLSAVMMLVVTVVSSLVHVYSVGYMAEDKSVPRFMAYLSLFTFAMLALVSADNFLQLFFGWEGVGLASYLLIGFWFEKKSANDAAIKAFIVNRVGDFGFLLGIFAVFLLFGTLDFTPVFQAAPKMVGHDLPFLSWMPDALTITTILLLIGAMGKSAQIGLHTWLADAMEGPTPVSALIHAATMVTAGVFLLCRISPMLEYAPVTLGIIVVVGGLTAIFAATIALVQTDIKRIIAYSTCSQLGYMFFAAGVSAYPAAMFHLTTHAFFKALLFLGAGSVIHALSGEQDVRKMGGLYRLIPFTYGVMWIGSLALAGIWPFAGYFSKDMIIDAGFAAHTSLGEFAYVVGVLTALLTAFYTFRLLFLTFHGAPRMDAHTRAHIHESPLVMTVPLFLLAAGAILVGGLFQDFFVGGDEHAFWGSSILILDNHPALAHAEDIPWIDRQLPLFAGLAGILMAFVMYVLAPSIGPSLARSMGALYRLLLNKWYVDELYDETLVKPSWWVGRSLWKGADELFIDGLTTDAPVAIMRGVSRRFSRMQTGYVYHYAFAMLIGVVGFVSWYIISQR